MQFCYLERLVGHIDTTDDSTFQGQRLGKNAAAATDIEYFLVAQTVAAGFDIVGSKRIDIVEGFKLAFGIPPATGKRLKFFNFAGIDIEIAHAVLLTLSAQDCALLMISSVLRFVSW